MDSDDRLLIEGLNRNTDHKLKVKDRLMNKRFIHLDLASSSWNLFHYTSPEGLKSILSTRTLYFTDSQFLNDYREKVNINDEVGEFWKQHVGKYDKRFYKLLNKIKIQEYEDNGFSYLDSKSNVSCR